MTRQAYHAPRIFDGEQFLENAFLLVEDQRVVALTQERPSAEWPLRAVDHGFLCPGFLDLQVNGGDGVMLNDDPSVAAMQRIASAHRRVGGVTGLLPTLITNSQPVTLAALEAASAAQGEAGILGVHLEGPHLDPVRKGAHLAAFMRPVTDEDIELYESFARRIDRLLLTIAACQVTPQQVRRLADSGIFISLGHTDCTAEEAEKLFDAGVHAVTHLFNAMSGMSHRSPGLATIALDRGDVWGGIIADGHHVDPRMLSIAFRAKRGPADLFLISDAMALTGSGLDDFQLNGRLVRRDQTGFCSKLTLDDGTLAGSDLTMLSAVRYCVEMLAVPLADALRHATSSPARFLQLEHERGTFRAGARADVLHLSDKLDLVFA